MNEEHRVNCWEFHKCGRERGGVRAKEQGICPAANEKRLDGIHGGKNAGRSCWVVAGTFCGGEVQGSFAQKVSNCSSCEFYKRVVREDFQRFTINQILKTRLVRQRKKKAAAAKL